jgi:hypothetical protein
VLGKTSLSDVASFTVGFYNLTDNAIEIAIENVMANGRPLRASSSARVVSRNGVWEVEFEPYPMTYYGAAVITVICRVGEERYLERFVPQRIRTESYWRAVLDNPTLPKSVEEYSEMKGETSNNRLDTDRRTRSLRSLASAG